MRLRATTLAAAAALAFACSASMALTLRVANQGDANSMDPHSLNESLQLSFTGNVYEPLVGRDKLLGLAPALATKWTASSPTVWRFALRRGVTFHDGQPFTADDVVFGFQRAAGEGSDMKGYTSAIKEVRKLDAHTVEIEKSAPFPILPDVISLVYYPNGFEVGMNCPNDRYVNDGEICQAVAADLARIGVKVNLQAESKATYFPKVLSRNTSFYLLGWTPGTYDAHNALSNLMATRTEKGQGTFNLGAYSNPKLDELTLKVQSETDAGRRNAMIAEAFKLHADDIGHIPLHQQALAWAMKKNVQLVQLADNFMPYKWVVLT